MIKKLKLLGLSRYTIGVFIVNWFFQRIFRINSRFPYLVHFTNKITDPKKVFLIGEGYHTKKCLLLNGGIYLGGSNGIHIHNTCLLANSVKIISGNHDFKSFDDKAIKESPVVIEKNCWLGAGAIILPGVHLKASTIVGAGAVVTKSFKQGNIIIAGNPAKIIKKTK